MEIYKVQRDNSFYDQQKLLADLKEEDARHVGVQASTEQYRQEEIGVLIKSALATPEKILEKSLFLPSADKVRSIAGQAAIQRGKPILLIAPFSEGLTEFKDVDASFRISLRRNWLNQPWQSDMIPMDGLLGRPLSGTDLDVSLIRQTLSNIPIVLVYGEMQRNRRIWASVVAWNIAESTEQSLVHVTLPPFSIPSASAGFDSLSPTQRLEFEDALGRAIAITVGVFGEWHHLLRYGRTPRLHRLLPVEMKNERRSIAAGFAAAYDLAVERGVVHLGDARIEQAEIYLEANLVDRSIKAAREALEKFKAENILISEEQRVRVRKVASILREAQDIEGHVEALELLEISAKRAVLEAFGWGE
ncbi:hypothetical protein [Streptosporangium sp. NPDC049644]|uniref:hypothetical protein n=1 Tax=Streptosporangium sp. NPDC049644 TaxID=3155507 RepID=UPI00343C09A6